MSPKFNEILVSTFQKWKYVLHNCMHLITDISKMENSYFNAVIFYFVYSRSSILCNYLINGMICRIIDY